MLRSFGHVLIVMLPSMLLIMSLCALTAPAEGTFSPQAPPTSHISTTTITPHLELSIAPAAVAVGAIMTLHVTYVNLGLPYTTVKVDPPTLVQFEPPLTMPCKYDQHPTHCTDITLRAIAPGDVTFEASATGEIYDDQCSCWRWSGGSSIAPARAIISGTILYLPVVQR